MTDLHLVTNTRRCTATTVKGEPCKSKPLKGRDICKMHSGDPDVGQPSRLNDTTHKIIVQALASGCYRETAALHAGIGVSTFYRWLEQGEADWEAHKSTPHRELWEAIKKAEADAEIHATALIRKAAPTNWQAAAWLLERKYPKRWGRQERVEHVGDNGKPIEVTLPQDPERARQVAAILMEVGAIPHVEDTGGDGNGSTDGHG